MVSRQQRDAERRRAAKAQARYERAAKLRRERRIVAICLVAGLLVLAGVVAAVTLGDVGDDPAVDPTATVGATATATATAEATAGATEAGASPSIDPNALPTTVPRTYDAPPPATDSLGTTWTATVTTNLGDIVLELDGAAAPQAVASFLMLASDGFYDGTACHRLLPDALLQCGDPTASGTGGPGYSFGPIENSPSDQTYPAGTVAMARQPGIADSQGSQFFLVFEDTTLPDDAAGGYTVFGTVTQGLDILQSVGAAGTTTGASDGPPATAVIIEKVTIS